MADNPDTNPDTNPDKGSNNVDPKAVDNKSNEAPDSNNVDPKAKEVESSGSPEQAPAGAKTIDYVGAAIMQQQMPDQAITSEMLNAEGFDLKPVNFEESAKINQKAIQALGITKEEFKGMYNQVYGKVSDNTLSNFNDLNTTPGGVDRSWLIQDSKKHTFINPRIYGATNLDEYNFIEADHRKAEAGKYFDIYGNHLRGQHEEQVADNRGFYFDRNGEQKSLDEYKDYSDGNVRYGEDGNPFMLVLDGTTWVEADANKIRSNAILRSSLGPKTLEDSFGSSVAGSVFNTLIDESYGTLGFGIEAVMGMISGTESDWAKYGRLIQNQGNSYAYKGSELTDELGFWSARGFANVTASGLTQLAVQSAFAMATFGLGNVASLPFKTLKGGNKIAKMLKTAANATIRNRKRTGIAFSGLYAGGTVRREAANQGVDDEAALWLGAAGMMAVMASETMLSRAGFSGMADDLFGGGAKQETIESGIRKSISEGIEQAAPKLAAATTDKAKAKIVGGFGSKLAKKIYDFKGANAATRAMGKVGQVGVKVGSKGKQFLSKGFGLTGKALGALPRKSKAFVSGGTEEGMEEVVEHYLNSVAAYAYNKGFAPEGATVGKGKMDIKWDLPLEEFVGGALVGGLVGVVKGGKAQKASIQDTAYANLAIEGLINSKNKTEKETA